MSPLEIVVIVVCALFVVGVIVGTIVKKVRNKKKGIVGCCDCSACASCPHCCANKTSEKEE